MAGAAAENQGWFAYSVVPLVAVFVTLLPLLLQLAIRAVLGRTEKVARDESFGRLEGVVRSSVPRFQSLNTRYFSAVQLGALITLPLVLLIPLVGTQAGRSPYAAASLIMLCLSCGVALLYVNRKGDLRWVGAPGAPAGGIESSSEGPSL